MPRQLKKLTPQAALDFPRILDAHLDPQGSAVAYVVADFARQNTALPSQSIWLVDANGGRAAQFSGGARADFHPRWSPDGRRIAFLSDRIEDGLLQLYVMDRAGGEAVPLARLDGEIDASRSKDAVQWSPDGRQIAALLIDPESQREQARLKESGGAVEFEKNPRYTRLWTIDVATGQKRLVTRAEAQVWEFQWSPDGRDFALIVSDLPYEWSWYESRLARVPASGGKLKTVFAPIRRQLALPRWSPDKKRIAFISSIVSDRGSVGGGVFVVAARGGQPQEIAPGYGGSVGWMEWIRNGRALRIAGYEQGEAMLGELDIASGGVKTLWRQPVELAERYWPRFSMSRDGRVAAAVRSAPSEARNVWRAAIEKNGLRWKRLTNSVPDLSDYQLGEQTLVDWTSRDGWPMRGILIKPVGYKKGRRYPLIVNPHGGPTSIAANGFLGVNLWGQLLAARGYAVFLPNYRGSAGFGLKFAEANLGDLGGMDFEDIDSGVDALIARGIADAGRLGFGGWSYGGFLTAWTITRTDRYKAAVMGAGISNWLTFHGNSRLHTWDSLHYNASPYEREGPYQRYSAMRWVSRVKTPTLILHGELDRDVPPEQSYQFYRALRDHGVDCELVVYKGMEHTTTLRSQWLDLHRRIGEWYDRYLK